MPSSPKLYTIQEYGGFVQSQQPVPGYQILPESSFQALEDYLLQSRGLTDQSEAVDFLSLSVRRGIGKVITAKNYVGVIALKDGTVIETLPKIHAVEESLERTRDILLRMLRSLRHAPFKEFSWSGLRSSKLSIFEVFMRM